jgi:CheY-like chemotaxis protein
MPSIMLVDDEDSTRDILADLLREQGHVVMEARSGESALQQLERLPGAVTLVTDIDLGSGMSGLELAAAARALQPDIRLMIISGCSISPSHADTVLLKPFSSELFVAKVTDLATGRMSDGGRSE